MKPEKKMEKLIISQSVKLECGIPIIVQKRYLKSRPGVITCCVNEYCAKNIPIGTNPFLAVCSLEIRIIIRIFETN